MIFWANVGYPISILLLGKVLKRKETYRNNYEPTVTIMIVAHNEEKVIREKLLNVLSLNYPKKKITILVTSDNSTDKTNEIVEEIIKENPKRNLSLYKVKQRKGKTNAQNEAAKLVKSEILVMTDANAILGENAIRELVKCFTKNVAYVSGRLIYVNGDNSQTSANENSYWDMETRIRQIESNIQTITAGNGALYAIKTKDYYNFDPVRCHDSAMPFYFAHKQKRAIASEKAMAYEKAGENNKDEFKRKVRTFRNILIAIYSAIKMQNVFKYKWAAYFYFGHRLSRYLLWFNHIMLLACNIVLVFHSSLYWVPLSLQLLVYLMAVVKIITKTNNKLISFVFYYCMTIVAQLVAVIKESLGKSKPIWEKAESTR